MSEIIIKEFFDNSKNNDKNLQDYLDGKNKFHQVILYSDILKIKFSTNNNGISGILISHIIPPHRSITSSDLFVKLFSNLKQQNYIAFEKYINGNNLWKKPIENYNIKFFEYSSFNIINNSDVIQSGILLLHKRP